MYHIYHIYHIYHVYIYIPYIPYIPYKPYITGISIYKRHVCPGSNTDAQAEAALRLNLCLDGFLTGRLVFFTFPTFGQLDTWSGGEGIKSFDFSKVVGHANVLTLVRRCRIVLQKYDFDNEVCYCLFEGLGQEFILIKVCTNFLETNIILVLAFRIANQNWRRHFTCSIVLVELMTLVRAFINFKSNLKMLLPF